MVTTIDSSLSRLETSAWLVSSTRRESLLLTARYDNRLMALRYASQTKGSVCILHIGSYHDDLICTTPRLCQNNMTPVALRGRGTTSTYNCFLAIGLYFKSKVLASVGRGSTKTTRLQHGSSMFGDTHAKGGGGDLATSMATWLSSSLRNENGKLKIFVVRTTLLAKSHRC